MTTAALYACTEELFTIENEKALRPLGALSTSSSG